MHYDVAPIAGFDPSIGILLASLQDSTREWREELGEPSIEAIVWQPASNFHSIGAILLHIADVELYWFSEFAAGIKSDPADLDMMLSKQIDQDKVQWPAPPAEPIRWYLNLHDRMRQKAWEAIKGMDPERVYERRHNSYTLRWIVAHVVEHDSYHGGQAVLLHEMWKKLRN